MSILDALGAGFNIGEESDFFPSSGVLAGDAANWGGSIGIDPSGGNLFGNSGGIFNGLGNGAGNFFGELGNMGANLASGIFGNGSQTGLLQSLIPNLNQLAAQAGLLGNQQPTQQTPTTTPNNTLIYLAIGAVILVLVLRK